jgi:hypothetical protein
MKTATVSSPTKAPRRGRHGVEYCLVLAISCFAALSTFNAITGQPGTVSSERVAVRPQ